MSGAAIIARQNRLIRTFRAAGATSAASARTLDELGVARWPVFMLLESRGVFVQTGEAWYLDEAAAAAYIKARRFRVAVFITIALIAMAIVMMVTG